MYSKTLIPFFKKIVILFAGVLNQIRRLTSKKIYNKKYFFIVMLHDVAKSEIKKCEETISKLQNEFGFIDPQYFSNLINDDKKINNNLLLTFDDGFISNYFVAKHILEPLGIKAIFFIPTGFIDCKSTEEQEEFIYKNIYNGKSSSSLSKIDKIALSWSQIYELLDMGHTIGSHTINHYRLSEIDDINILKEEIISSGDYLEKKLNIKINHFAYPFGEINSINKKALDIAKNRYKYIHSGIRGANIVGTNSSIIFREAINVTDHYNYNKFVITGGLSNYYYKAQNILREFAST